MTTMHCPACGGLSEFRVMTRIDSDPETGPSDQEYAICDVCHSAIDAGDLDRQHQLEEQDDVKRAGVIARIRPVITQDGDRTYVEFRCDLPLMEGMVWAPATVIAVDHGSQQIAVARWMLNTEQCIAMTIAMRMAIEWCATEKEKVYGGQ